MKKLLVIFLVLFLGALLAALASAYWIHRQMNEPLPLTDDARRYAALEYLAELALPEDSKPRIRSALFSG